ncbi:hypothetical protein MM213_09775 [Belliella sp. R4-6]|uniref:ATP-binding protein n=1 Tax=Belliella alkalica TaxID=1730871 RepID=A0ABS9VBF3_9BACT|nr:hypothetical protein [Belliella alkalica]MCH7413772.1 hypothetical protein [Belliella alkalica]
MKKLYTTSKFKKLNSQRSKKRLRNRVRRKNKKYNPTIRKTENESVRPVERKPTQNIEAPKKFSLIENTEEVLAYFKTARTYLSEGYPIRFDISEIDALTTDAIALQIARIKDANFHKNKGILGNAPNNPKLKELFLQSGFYNYVQTQGPKPQIKDTTLIHKITDNKVEPLIAKEACLSGLRHTFNSEEIFDPLYDIIIEIMQNTNNHAGEERGKYDWWIHIYNDPISKTSKYTFLDLGVGIFESLPARTFKEKTLAEKLGFSHNVDLIEPLFNGEIKSRTGRPERGNGIPQVYDSSKDKAFSKFVLITNDVFVNLKTLETKKLKNNFSGTLFYWELKQDNDGNGN